jgi:hypothetical protein
MVLSNEKTVLFFSIHLEPAYSLIHFLWDIIRSLVARVIESTKEVKNHRGGYCQVKKGSPAFSVKQKEKSYQLEPVPIHQ